MTDTKENIRNTPRKTSVGKSTNSTWTVRGVGQETKNAVAKAAELANLTQGEWLNRHCLRAAHDQLKQKYTTLPANPEDTNKLLVKFMERFEESEKKRVAEQQEISIKIQRLERKSEKKNAQKAKKKAELKRQVEKETGTKVIEEKRGFFAKMFGWNEPIIQTT